MQQLGDLLQCKKKYEMSCVIQSKEVQQERVFRSALDQMLVSVIEKTEKNHGLKLLNRYLLYSLKTNGLI